MAISFSPTARKIVNALTERGESRVEDLAQHAAVPEEDANAVLHGEIAPWVKRDDRGAWSLASAVEDQRAATATQSGGSTHGAADVDSEAQECPVCGGSMIARIARRGPNAGGKFLGCRNYPKCKGTRDLPADSVATPSDQRQGIPDEDRAFRLPARVGSAISDIAEDAMVQSVGVPRQALPSIARGGLASDYRRALSQWRMRLARVGQPISIGSRASLAVAEKLLQRGTYIPVPDELYGGGMDGKWTDAARTAAVCSRSHFGIDNSYDSVEEKVFVEAFARSSIDGLAPWILSQVPLAPLAQTAKGISLNRRVDFLLARPGMAPVVVEVDGEQHAAEKADDDARDQQLAAVGVSVDRIPASAEEDEIASLVSQKESGRWRDHTLSEYSTAPLAGSVGALVAAKRFHQIQTSLVYACIRVFGSEDQSEIAVGVDGPWAPEWSVIEAAVSDLGELLEDLASLYGERSPRFVPVSAGEECDVLLRFGGSFAHDADIIIYIDDLYLPFDLLSDRIASVPSSFAIKVVSKDICQRMVRRIYGFDSLRQGQFEAMQRMLQGEDTLVLLPTGAGKSIAFQLPALLRPGTCIVVDPILSLIEDQIDNLKDFGIDSAGSITSQIPAAHRQSVQNALAAGEYTFCYIAPERFQSLEFRQTLQAMTVHTPVSLVAIDEVHCVSEWGHDFRPSYLNLASTVRQYCTTNRVPPPIAGLTGTASRSVLKDVQRETGIFDFEAIITPKTFDRPELRFRLVDSRSEEKLPRIQGAVDQIAKMFGRSTPDLLRVSGESTSAGLIFCPFVRGENGIISVAAKMETKLKSRVPFYGSRAPAGTSDAEWSIKRSQISRGFKADDFSLMVCTKAFGMGIDKSNVRYTIHHSIPPSIESFYQEAGRAGRDGSEAVCVLVYSNDDPQRSQRLLDPASSLDSVKREIDKTPRSGDDDITRALWFHINAFAGLESDRVAAEETITKIGDLSHRRACSVHFGSDKLATEKTLHRLLTVGIVEDYTVDFPKKRFDVRLSGADRDRIVSHVYRYMSGYQRDRAKVAADRLAATDGSDHQLAVAAVGEILRFVYDVVERSRRQALSEMLATCESAQGDEGEFRARLLAYLETTAFTDAVERVIDARAGGLEESVAVLAEILSGVDAAEVRGQTARALESYPDHPGLRILRAGAEAMSGDRDEATCRENVVAAVRFATQEYGLEPQTVVSCVLQAASCVGDVRPEHGHPLVTGLLDGVDDGLAAARLVIRTGPTGLIEPAIDRLLNEMRDSALKNLKENSHAD